jgi:DNA polymerase III subunit delta
MSHHCFDILLNNQLPGQLPGVVVLLGDEGFLRRETLNAIAKLASWNLAEARTFDGEECSWVDVHDELATLSLFESDALRIAIVADADTLVTRARAQLEKWCDSPATGSVLLMQIETMPANTKLYKIIAKQGWVIGCGLPPAARGKGVDEGALRKWVGDWAQSRHQLKLKAPQCKMVLDAVGPNCGLIHQELAKLALYSNDQGVLTDETIREHVGTWSTRTMWEIADCIMDGKVVEALTQLERVFSSGQHAAAVVPQIAWSLRRYGHAAQLILQSRRLGKLMNAEEAIKLSGFWGPDLAAAPNRLRRIGLPKASKLLDWLLELDIKIKGSHSQVDRAVFALEELCLRFA